MSLPDKPQNDVERYLDNLTGGSSQLPTKPKNNIERYLAWLVENGGGGGGGGTTNYNQLSNKPQIGGVTLSGNKSLSDLGAAASDVVLVQDAEPSSPTNKLWIKETASGPVQIPEMSDIADFVASSTIETIWVGTQAEYDLIVTPSATTLYLIKEATS